MIREEIRAALQPLTTPPVTATPPVQHPPKVPPPPSLSVSSLRLPTDRKCVHCMPAARASIASGPGTRCVGQLSARRPRRDTWHLVGALSTWRAARLWPTRHTACGPALPGAPQPFPLYQARCMCSRSTGRDACVPGPLGALCLRPTGHPTGVPSRLVQWGSRL